MNKKNSSWKEGIQTFGRSLLLPIALLAPTGMIMGICSAMGQSYMTINFLFWERNRKAYFFQSSVNYPVLFLTIFHFCLLWV